MGVILFLSGCDKIMPVPIGKIKDNPREYSGKIVTIEGEVSKVFSLFIVKYFSLKDKSGEIIIISDKPLPKTGTKLTVKGKVEEAFSLGDQQLLVVVEGEDK
jgi:hypothetical protein